MAGTFAPDTIRTAESRLERHPGWRRLEDVFGKASELVEIDRAYDQVAHYLLGSILICRHLKAAAEAARIINYSCRVISLDGDLINPGGAIRGGSMPRRSAGQPLGRRREIETLKRQLSADKKSAPGRQIMELEAVE